MTTRVLAALVLSAALLAPRAASAQGTPASDDPSLKSNVSPYGSNGKITTSATEVKTSGKTVSSALSSAVHATAAGGALLGHKNTDDDAVNSDVTAHSDEDEFSPQGHTVNPMDEAKLKALKIKGPPPPGVEKDVDLAAKGKGSPGDVPDYSQVQQDPSKLNAVLASLTKNSNAPPKLAAQDPPSSTANSVPPQAQTQAMTGNAAQAEAAGQEGTASVYSLLGGHPEAAEQQATRALVKNGNDAGALSTMMLLRRQQGRTAEAQDLARRALAVDPQNPVAKLVAGHADSLARGEALEKKLSKLDFGKTADPGLLGAGLSGGAARGMAAGAPAAQAAGSAAAGAAISAQAGPAGASSRATPVYDEAQLLSPAQQLVIRAVRRHEIGDEQGAMLALTQAIDQDPNEAGAFVVRAEVDNSLTKYAEAVLDATRGVELSPTKPALTARALRARAYAHLETKDWVAALADASRATELDPQSGLAYLYRAMAEDKLGRGSAASDDLAQAVKLDPALTPLAKPLMAKYGLQPAGGDSRPIDRRVPVAVGSVAVAALLLGFGLRKLFVSSRLTTTSTPAA